MLFFGELSKQRAGRVFVAIFLLVFVITNQELSLLIAWPARLPACLVIGHPGYVSFSGLGHRFICIDPFYVEILGGPRPGSAPM